MAWYLRWAVVTIAAAVILGGTAYVVAYDSSELSPAPASGQLAPGAPGAWPSPVSGPCATPAPGQPPACP